MVFGPLRTFVHVVTLNVWGLPDLPFKRLTPARPARIAAICDELRKSATDPSGWEIVFIQEAWLAQDRELLKSCGYPYCVDLDEAGRKIDSGLLVLSRYPIDSSSLDRLTFSVGGNFSRALEDGEYFARKSGVVAKVLHPRAGSIWIANTHLIAAYSDHSDIYTATREKQLREFVTWARRRGGDDPMIIGGDLNFSPGSSLWELFQSHLPEFTHAPVEDSFWTYPTLSHLGDLSPCKIDHILASRHFSPVSCGRTFDQMIEVEGERIPLSDHFGFETQFKLQLDFIEERLPTDIWEQRPFEETPIWLQNTA